MTGVLRRGDQDMDMAEGRPCGEGRRLQAKQRGPRGKGLC